MNGRVEERGVGKGSRGRVGQRDEVKSPILEC